MKFDLLRQVNAIREAGESAVVATDLATGAQEILRPLSVDSEGAGGADATASDSSDLMHAARAALAQDRSEVWEDGDRSIFLQVFNPPVRVIIVGAVHIAQSLSVMVREAGFEVSVIDPREAFATSDRFPGVDLHCAWPEAAMEKVGLDHRAAIVTVTHDPKVDDPALQAALASPAFYIGALGSRRTQAKRLDRLRAAGFDDAALERIHAPVGLDIGARSPGEIAGSVLAEIIQTLRKTVGPAVRVGADA